MDEAALRAAGPGHHEIEEHYELIKYYLGRIEKGGIKSIDERLIELVVEGEQKKMEDSAQAERGVAITGGAAVRTAGGGLATL